MRFRKCCGLLLMAAGVLAMLSGCNFGGDHEHSYNKWAVTKTATCVDAGVQSRECEECGYMQTETIPALGHTTTKDPAVKATCTEEGLTEGSHCGVCGEVLLAQQAIPAFGHAPLVDFEVKATCTSEGLTEGSHCGICGVTIEAQEIVPPTGHQYDNVSVVTPANCMQMGTMRYACIYCDTSYLDTYSTTEHTVVVKEAVPVTCTTDGLTEGRYCEVCQLVFSEQEVIPALGHVPVTDLPVDATCTTDGLTEGSHCQVCEEILTPQEVIPAPGHQNQETILVEATCQTNGVKQYFCLVCGELSQGEYALPVYGEKELYSAAAGYVCEIVTYDKNGNVYRGGIGFVYSSDGKIITTYENIAGAYSAQVTLGGATYTVSLVLAYDQEMDIAVLQINASGLTAARICTCPLTAGDTVYALSALRGLDNTYATGAVLTPSKEVDGLVYVQHNATITAANSGGPLLNIYGEVVGINTYAASNAQGTNLAVFVSELERLDYTKAQTLAQIYRQNTSDFQKLVDGIYANGSWDDAGNMVVYGSYTTADFFFVYELGYCVSDGRIYIKQYNKSDSGQQIDTLMYISQDSVNMPYMCTFSIANTVYNQLGGTLDATTYTETSELTYDTYQGMKGYESTLLSLYKTNMNRMIDWLDDYLSTNLDLSIVNLGFTEYAY